VPADTFRALLRIEIWPAHRIAGKTRSEVIQPCCSTPADGAGRKWTTSLSTLRRLQTKKTSWRVAEDEPHRQEVIPDAPHEVLLVLDATTGQNGWSRPASLPRLGVTGSCWPSWMAPPREEF